MSSYKTHLIKPTIITPFRPSIQSIRSEPKSSNNIPISVSGAPIVSPVIPDSPPSSSPLEVDRVSSLELKENGFRSTRRTKFVCTIGPSTSDFETIEALALGGMNVARLNMCHNTREWHKEVIENVRRLNEDKGFAVAVMMDTQGSEIHMGDLAGSSSVKAEVCGFSLFLL